MRARQAGALVQLVEEDPNRPVVVLPNTTLAVFAPIEEDLHISRWLLFNTLNDGSKVHLTNEDSVTWLSSSHTFH